MNPVAEIAAHSSSESDQASRGSLRPAPPVRGVLHLVDSLAAGGAERVAVNLANAMPRQRFRMYLGTTRCEGPLVEYIAADVGRLQLNRTRRFDGGAIRRLAAYLRRERIDVIHAHSSTIAVAHAAAWLVPTVKVLWHDHFGRFDVERRSTWLYRLLTWKAAGVVAVNEPLAAWSRSALGFPAHRVWYVPNFAAAGPSRSQPSELPGTPAFRIVCVANLRPQKDHVTLVAAMEQVVDRVPAAHLLLLGTTDDRAQTERVTAAIAARGLQNSITVLGSRSDVPEVLRASAVGVLSSVSEGLPLSLLEYGLAGLPPVVTRVGQCPEVVDQGRCGLLVSPGEPQELASALVELLLNEARRQELARSFRERVALHYSQQAAVERLTEIYEQLLKG